MRISDFDPRLAPIASSPPAQKTLAVFIGSLALGIFTANATAFFQTPLRRYTPLYLIPAALTYLTLLHGGVLLGTLAITTLFATNYFFYIKSRPKQIPLPPRHPFRPKRPLKLNENGNLIIRPKSVKRFENLEVKRYIDGTTQKTYLVPPLHFALWKKSPPVLIQYALEKGCNPNEVDLWKQTARDYVEENSAVETLFIKRGIIPPRETDSSHGSSDDDVCLEQLLPV